MTTECSAHHFSDHELGLTCAIWGSFAPRNLATRLSFNRLNLQEAGASQLALWPWSSSTHKANTQMITSHDAPNKKSNTTLPQFIKLKIDLHKHQHFLSGFSSYILYWFDWLPGMPLWNLRLSPERQVREVRGDAESHLTYPRARDKARAQNSHLCTMCRPKALGPHNSTEEIKMQNGTMAPCILYDTARSVFFQKCSSIRPYAHCLNTVILLIMYLGNI